MALNDKGEESLMRIKEPQKREKCPLKVTQLQRLNSLSSQQWVSVLPWGVLPPAGPRHPPVSHLPSPLSPPALAEHPWAPGDNGHVTLDLVSVTFDQQGSQSALSHPILCCLRVLSRSHVCLFATPRTVDHQAPLSTGFSRQEYCHFLLQGILPNPGIEPGSPVTPGLPGRLFTTEPPGTPSLSSRTIHFVLWSGSFPLTALLTNTSAWSSLWSLHSFSRPLGPWPQFLELSP